MLNLVSGILLSISLISSNLSDSCNDYIDNHPIRSDIMMQIVLKSYGYYDGKIDGIFGNISKNALISLQNSNDIDADGKIGPQTCNLLLDKKNVIKKNKLTTNISKKITDKENKYSQEIYDAQIILKNLEKEEALKNESHLSSDTAGISIESASYIEKNMQSENHASSVNDISINHEKSDNMEQISNQIIEDTPYIFSDEIETKTEDNQDDPNLNKENDRLFDDEGSNKEEDFEIPAFLRKHKF